MFEITDKYNEVVDAFVKNNFAEASEANLSKQVAGGSDNVLQEGDVVDLPKDGKLYVNQNMNNAVAVFGKVTNARGMERTIPIYLSSLNKSICVVTTDSDGEVVKEEFVDAKGTAAAEYQKYRNMTIGEAYKAFTAACPKGFKVSKVEKVKTYGFDRENNCRDTSKLVNSNLYTFDLVV